jgi:Ca2+-binding RTX toxin-like protein
MSGPSPAGVIVALSGTWSLGVSAAGELSFTVTMDDGSQHVLTSSGAGLADGAWHDVAVSYTAGRGIAVLHVDGAVVGWLPMPGTPADPARPGLMLANGNGMGAPGFAGDIAALELRADNPRGPGATVDPATGQLAGTAAADQLYGGSGDDSLLGQAGDDILFGLAGDDRLAGGDDSDLLLGGGGLDSLNGGLGDDVIRAGEGDDLGLGSTGRDEMLGSSGNDLLDGGSEDDRLFGGTGDDSLLGGSGNDSLLGSIGDDRIDGGTGNDLIWLGGGADLVRVTGAGGQDVVTCFQRGIDRIELAGTGVTSFAQLALSGSADVVIDYGAGTITLLGVTPSQLAAGDIIFS